jgi:hypothetical protein
MVPSSAFHVTAVLEDVPATLPLNCSVPPVTDEAVPGVTVTAVTPDPVVGAVELATATVAVADFVGSATLVATIVPVPLTGGAVKTPVAEMVPIDAAQVTASFVVAPWIAAVNCTFALGAGVATGGDTTIDATTGFCEDRVPCKGSL